PRAWSAPPCIANACSKPCASSASAPPRSASRSSAAPTRCCAKTSCAWRDPDPQDFVQNILLDATRQMDAAAAYAIGFDPAANHWRCFVHVENGAAGAPPFSVTATPEETRIVEVLKEFKEPVFYPLEPLDKLLWPGVADWHEREGHKSAYLLQ